MSFRAFSLDTGRAALLGLFCLSICSVSRAGDMTPQHIEIVPLHHSATNGGVNLSRPAETKNFDNMYSGAEHPFKPDDSLQGVLPPPRPPQQTAPLTRQQQMLLDRRRNWVFMTPEELLLGNNSDNPLSRKEYDRDSQDKNPSTAMERYLQRLYNSDHQAATNQADQRDSDPFSKTNSIFGDSKQDDKTADPTHPFDSSPFDSHPNPGIFQPLRPAASEDIFGLKNGSSASDADDLQAQQQQQAHIESFKQLWNIDQPSASSGGSFSTPDRASSASGSLGGMQPVYHPPAPTVSSQPSPASVSATPQPINTPPPPPQHLDFSIPRRSF
jgi:hypothetical protein